MRDDFNPHSHVSLLEVMFFFLGKHSAKIHRVQKIGLMKNGKVVRGAQSRNMKTRGIEIRFSITGLGSAKALRYFQLNAKTPEFDKNHRGFIAYLTKNSKRYVRLLKAASYLLNPVNGLNFTTVRNLILNNSSYVVQDESGIPLRFFSKKGWKINAYGRYQGPIHLFRNYKQDTLIEMTQTNRALNFSWGYRGGRDPSKSVFIVAKPQQ